MNTYAALMSTAVFVTAEVPINRETVKPGWIALGLVFALGVALVILLRSFVKHTKRASQPWDSDRPVDRDGQSG